MIQQIFLIYIRGVESLTSSPMLGQLSKGLVIKSKPNINGNVCPSINIFDKLLVG